MTLPADQTTRRPNLWTVKNVEVLSECDVCGECESIAQTCETSWVELPPVREIDLTKAAGLAEARRVGWRMVRGRWTCPECKSRQGMRGGSFPQGKVAKSWDDLVEACESMMPENPVILESTPRTKEEQLEFERMLGDDSCGAHTHSASRLPGPGE